MPRRRIVLIAGVVVVAIAAAVTTTLVVGRDPQPGTSFEVNGQRYPCGNSGQIRLTASVQYPDPDAAFTLDGEQQPTTNDATGYVLQMDSAPVYDCGDGSTHHLNIKSGERNPFGPGCSINLESLDPTVLNGRNIVYQVQPRFVNDTNICDLTWTA